MESILDLIATEIAASPASYLVIRCQYNKDKTWRVCLVVKHTKNSDFEDKISQWTTLPRENILPLLDEELKPEQGEGLDVLYHQLTNKQRQKLLNGITFAYELGTEDNPLPQF